MERVAVTLREASGILGRSLMTLRTWVHHAQSCGVLQPVGKEDAWPHALEYSLRDLQLLCDGRWSWRKTRRNAPTEETLTRLEHVLAQVGRGETTPVRKGERIP